MFFAIFIHKMGSKLLENTDFEIARSKNIEKDILPASLGQKIAERWRSNFPAKNSEGKSGPIVGLFGENYLPCDFQPNPWGVHFLQKMF